MPTWPEWTGEIYKTRWERGQIIPDTMLRCLDSSLSIVGSLWITLKPKSNVILAGRRLKIRQPCGR